MRLRVLVCRLATCSMVLCLAVSARVVAQTSQLAAGWMDADLGTPAIAGSAGSVGDGAIRVSGAGADIWGTSDQGHFVYRLVTGNVDLRARVDGITGPVAWSKAGVMIRASLAANAAQAFALVSIGKGAAYQRRDVTGGSSLNSAGPAIASPAWVRLVRAGTTVTAFTSADGVSWTAIGTDTIQLSASVYVGVAVTSHDASAAATTTVSQVAVLTAESQGLPTGVADADIGQPALAGSATYSGGTYAIRASGADIWGTADQLHFVYERVTGDLDVRARVASISAADRWSKAGVMVRASLEAGSPQALALASAAKGYAFQRRLDADGLSVSSAGTAALPPGWVRLRRSGDLFTAYQSVDGQTWTVINSDVLPMTATVYVGLAATSHAPAALTTAVIDSFAVTTTASAAGGSTSGGSTSGGGSSGGGSSGGSTGTSSGSNSGGSSGAPGPVSIQFQDASPAGALFFEVEVFAAGVDTGSTLPLRQLNIGLPAQDASGFYSADITQFFDALTPGTYQVTVSAMDGTTGVRSVPIAIVR